MTSPTRLDGVDAVRAATGSDLGTSDWLAVDADRVAQFAAATGCPADGLGVPPELLLSLSNFFLPQIVEVRGVSLGVNYGTEKVRYPTPVHVGMRVRARARLADCIEVPGGVQTTMLVTVETAQGDTACVIESLSRWME